MAPKPVMGRTHANGWPPWTRGGVSLLLAFHLLAVLIAAFAADPASPLERRLAEAFSPYYQLIDQGYSYRYYAPEPPPTPVIECRMRFADGRPDQTVRLPDRATRPRMLYQRELALANHLYAEHMGLMNLPETLPEGVARPVAHWAPSFARHLGKRYGCQEATFFYRLHLVPPLGEIQHRLEDGAGAPIDLDADEFYTYPELIGSYPCDAS